ncbi:MAG: methyltransferase domain-containing protein [Leptospirales bacterium]|nr:methyltransferase domain-containing protein [Leptospirales bacterium]
MKIIIEDMVYGGYGVGRIDGKVFFVDCAIPGDVLEIQEYNDKKKYSFGKIVRILNPSENRISSPCPNFELCGGCNYLNLNYSDEIEFKKKILSNNLQKIASIIEHPFINTIVDERYHYRSHCNIKCNNKSYGFYERASNNIVQFTDAGCLLISENLIRNIDSLNICDYSDELRIAEDWEGGIFYDNNEVLTENVGSCFYKRDVKTFFQSNKFLRDRMLNLVCEYSELTKNDQFLDICSGCGFFTIPLSKIASHGIGYDIDKDSIKFAQINAQMNKCSNLKFFALSESEINPHRVNPKTIVIDPPRSGLSKKGRKTINSINPEIIVYVSCNPATYSRDIMDFIKNGYELKEITLIDMFPCTYHIELISKLAKKI